MRWLFSFLVVIFAAMVMVSGARAQGGPDIFVTPIPNNPFTGKVEVARSTVQKDGSVVKLATAREIGRDSHGRIFNEMRTLVPAGSNNSPEVIGVHIYDPQTRISTMVYDRARIYRRNTVNRPPEMVPPSFLSASSGLNTLPQNQFTREDDLGNKIMDGLPVHGVRQSQTLPAANGGKDIVITDEYWYSEDLRINLMIKHNDTRKGGVTMSVTQVNRAEPDPARFEIPEGYKLAGSGTEGKE